MDEAGVKLLMSLCYMAGIKDGWNCEDLPTLKRLDSQVNEIFNNYMMAKQEQMADEIAEDI